MYVHILNTLFSINFAEWLPAEFPVTSVIQFPLSIVNKSWICIIHPVRTDIFNSSSNWPQQDRALSRYVSSLFFYIQKYDVCFIQLTQLKKLKCCSRCRVLYSLRLVYFTASYDSYFSFLWSKCPFVNLHSFFLTFYSPNYLQYTVAPVCYETPLVSLYDCLSLLCWRRMHCVVEASFKA